MSAVLNMLPKETKSSWIFQSWQNLGVVQKAFLFLNHMVHNCTNTGLITFFLFCSIKVDITGYLEREYEYRAQ